MAPPKYRVLRFTPEGWALYGEAHTEREALQQARYHSGKYGENTMVVKVIHIVGTDETNRLRKE